MCVCEAKGWEQNGFFTRVICVGWEGLSCLCVCRDWDQNCGKIPHWDWLQRMGLNTNTSPSIYPTLFPLPLHISGCKLLPIWMLLLYWLRSDQILEPCGRILCLGLSTWSWRWQSCFFFGRIGNDFGEFRWIFPLCCFSGAWFTWWVSGGISTLTPAEFCSLVFDIIKTG